MPSTADQQKLVDNIERFRRKRAAVPHRGFIPTGLKGVEAFWSEQGVPRAPLVYEPGIAIILSGVKTGFLHDHRFRYDASHYLVVGLPVYFECEAEASPETPLVALFLHASTKLITELATLLADVAPDALPPDRSLGVEPLPVTARMHDAVRRLTELLICEKDTQLLGPQVVREIFCLALQDTHGRMLLAQAGGNRPASRIARLLARTDISGRERVEALARAADMSVPSFHRHFKAVTGYSPKKYYQRRRLFRAKSLLMFEGYSVQQAASAAGYLSASQFSREFRKLFGLPPSRAAAYSYNYEFVR